MSYPLRVESEEYSSFVTTRVRNSELWFVNNPALANAKLGYLAKYQETYDVTLFAFVMMGNHHHCLADFKPNTRAKFMRDHNSISARLTQSFQPGCPGGTLWGRRYSSEFVPGPEDIENEFFYCALQPVASGLAERISDYPGYNSFDDAIHGVERTFVVTDRAGYTRAKRLRRNVDIKDFRHKYKLRYTRLPGYEHLSQKDYAKLMLKKLEERRVVLVNERRAKKLGFAAPEQLLATRPGSLPHETKKSTRTSFRPLVLTRSFETKRYVLSWYFAIVEAHRAASRKFRNGDLSVEFPAGTFRPPAFCIG